MDNKKVYISISYLLFNIIKSNKLKYYLRKNENFRKEILKLIDLLLLLESDKFKCRYNRKKIAAEFAKAYVKITKVSNRFEATEEELSVEEMYDEYSSIITFISSNYKVTRKTLTVEEEPFTIEDIELKSKLTAEFIVKMDEKLAAEAKEKAETEPKKETQNTKIDQQQQTNNQQNQQAFNQQNFFNANMGMNGMPAQNIFLNPKFYPFKTKPKYMPIMKKIFTLFMLLTIIFYVALLIYVGTVRVDLNYKNEDSLIRVLFKNFNNWESNFTWWQIFPNKTQNVNIPTNVDIFGKQTTNVSLIIFAVFYLLWFGYMAYTFWKKQEASRLKYRVSGFTLLIVAIFVMFILFEVAASISPNFIDKKWSGFSILSIKEEQANSPNELNKFNFFNDFIARLKSDYNSQINVITSLSICALISSILTLMGALMLAVVNPKKDVQKFMKARQEQANATMAAMQGKTYEIDPALFDEEEQK